MIERGGDGTRTLLLRLFGSAWDAIVAFSDLPLRLIAALGVLISLGSFGYGTVLLVERILQFFGMFSDQEVLGFTTVAVSVFFMGGVQLVCLGVIGEYLAKIYCEVKGRPLYWWNRFRPKPARVKEKQAARHEISSQIAAPAALGCGGPGLPHLAPLGFPPEY